MTLAEFESTEDNKDGSYTLSVFRHKEARQGPIRVILKPELFSWLSAYVQIFRKWVVKDTRPNANVFLTWSGNNFEYSGDISTASNSLWKKAQMKGRCGANKFRKAAVSATRNLEGVNDKTHNDLANLMGHARTTADRYYNMQLKMASAQRAGKLLPETMRKVKDGQNNTQTPSCS